MDTPKTLAHKFWCMDNNEQAEFFEALQNEAGDHVLMMQGLAIRDACKKRSPEALDGFQTMFASAFTMAIGLYQ